MRDNDDCVPGVGIVAVEADAVGSVIVGVTVIAVFGGGATVGVVGNVGIIV